MKKLLASLAFALLSIAASATMLPTGATLDPAAPSHRVGSFPLGAALSPDGRYVALLLCGWRQEGVQIFDRSSGEVVQTLSQPAAFVGIAFSPDGQSLWASGGNDDSLYRYSWKDGRATLAATISLDKPKSKGVHYPAGLAFSADGKAVYVAENLSDTLAVVDAESGKVTQRLQADRYPYGVVAGKGGDIFVSSWGDDSIVRFHDDATRRVRRMTRIACGRHPSAMLLDEGRGRLFAVSASADLVEIIDVKSNAVIGTFRDHPPESVREGSTPNAIALSADGKRLYVAEADNNAVAVFTIVTTKKTITGRLDGRIPTEWYPTALLLSGRDLIVVNGKGGGSRPNPAGPRPDKRFPPDSTDYTLGQIDGSVMQIGVEPIAELPKLTQRVIAANHWNATRKPASYPPLKHVIYIVKENRTYDQVLGDLAGADGDPSLTFFPREGSPNHHALAQRFGTFDRSFVNAEVSGQGHNWSTAAYTTDYTEKTMPAHYSSRGREYDYQGMNRGRIVDEDDDVASPAAGYLWDLAIRKKVSLRDFGEYTVEEHEVDPKSPSKAVLPTRRALAGYIDPDYPTFDLDIPDQKRADVWLAALDRYTRDGSMPSLQILWLPNDHTAGAKAGAPTPRALFADNDLALGRIVSGLSHSPFWKDTVVFVLEDDAQAGPDHVDSHRSVLLVVSPYSAGGVIHRFTNTTDVLATIEEILGLDSLSQFDHFGRPLRDAFKMTADLQPYDPIKPNVDLTEKNPPATPQAKESAKLDFSRPDVIDDRLLNRILWETIKGNSPMPAARRAPEGAPGQ